MPTVSCRRQRKDRIMPVIEIKWEFETVKGFGSITISALMENHNFFMKPVLEDVPKQCEAV